MPVNFREIQQQIRQIGQAAPRRARLLQERRAQALEALNAHAGRLAELRDLVARATRFNNRLRCAVPAAEALDLRRAVPPDPPPFTLLAADGSQINPDRHNAVEFAVINAGAVRLRPGQPAAPEEITRTILMQGDDLETPTGYVSEEVVALQRDLKERTLLAELAASSEPPVVTLTDGPLELYREPAEDRLSRALLVDYLGVLGELTRARVITAGYVDKPRADLVVRLLELLLLPGGNLEGAGRERPLLHVRDEDLYQDLLQPGERSALFAIQSASSQYFRDELALHFFYLNVGRPGKPYLARVEVPAWLCAAPAYLDLLHAALVGQCRQMGANPYPYALTRAHEVAVVSFDEKQQLGEMISAELRRQGVEVGERSNKQVGKDSLTGRVRYGR